MVEVPAAATRHGLRQGSATPVSILCSYPHGSPDGCGRLAARRRRHEDLPAHFLNEPHSRSREHDIGLQEYDRLDPELSRLWRVTPNHGTQPLQSQVAETLFPPPTSGDKLRDCLYSLVQ